MWELAESVFSSYVRTFPIPPLRRFFEVPGEQSSKARDHLCLGWDHVSPFWYIRGATPSSRIRRW